MPCQVQRFRKLSLLEKEWEEKVPFVIGLYCHLNLEEEATLTLIETNNISLKEIEHFEYRGGPWPGRMRVLLKNGSNRYLHQFDIKDGALNYLKELFSPRRCFYCIDPANELADVSIADAWIRDDKGEWLLRGTPGWSIVLERTQTGSKILKNAIKEGYIQIKRLPRDLILSAHSAMIQEKKREAFLKLEKLRKKGRFFPQYHLDSPSGIRFQERFGEDLLFLSFFKKFRFMRRLFTHLAFSPLGTFFAKMKINWKRRKHRR